MRNAFFHINLWRLIGLVLIGMFLSFQGYGQGDLPGNSGIPKMKDRLRNAGSDTARINLMTDISAEYLKGSNLDSAWAYARRSMKLLSEIAPIYSRSDSVALKHLRAKVLGQVGNAWSSYDAQAALDTLQLALTLWKETGNKVGLAKAYADLGNTLDYKGDNVGAISAYNKALELIKGSGHKGLEADVLYHLSLVQRYLGSYGDALETCMKSLKVALEMGDTGRITEAHLGNGFNYMLSGRYNEAIEEQQKALTLLESEGDSTGIARAYNDLGVTDFFADRLEASLENHKKSLVIRRALNDARGASISYNYIAGVLKKLGKPAEALDYTQDGLAFALETGDSRTEYAAYSRMGNIYLGLGNYDKALANYDSALSIANRNDVHNMQALALFYIGVAHRGKGNDHAAIESLRSADRLVLPNAFSIRKDIYKELMDTYRSRNNYELAFANQAEYFRMKDSLAATEKAEKIATLTQKMSYENQRALLEVSQDKQLALSESQLKRQTLIRNVTLAGLVVVLGLALLLFKRFKEKRKLSLALEKSLTELKSAQSRLIQSEKLASLGQLTAGIAHEIKNPLNFVINFSDVSNDLVDEVLEQFETEGENLNFGNVEATLIDVKSNLSKINRHGTRADSIVKSMLQHSRGGDGKKDPTELNALVNEFANLAFHGMRAGKNPINVDLVFDLDEDVGKLDLISEDFGRVVVNLCSNAFDAMRAKSDADKSADSQADYRPTLTLRTKRTGEGVELSIADNGPGIPDEILNKILQPFFTTKRGTDGTGLGLSITNDIIAVHGGELKIKTQSDAEEGPTGTTFRIVLPRIS